MKKRTLIKIISASFMYPYQIFYHDTPDEFYAEFEQHSNYLQTLSQSNGERFEVSCLHSDDIVHYKTSVSSSNQHLQLFNGIRL